MQSEFHYNRITAERAMEHILANDQEYLVRLNTFCKFHIDTHQTVATNKKVIREELEKNTRGGIWFKSWGSDFVPAKPGPKGWKGHYVRVVDKEQYCSFYALVIHILMGTPCFNRSQVQQERMIEYWKTRKIEDTMNLVWGENWNKFEAHKHLTNLQYKYLLELEDAGEFTFPGKEDRKELLDSRKEERIAKHIAKLKAKLDSGEKLSQTDWNWLSNNKLSVKDIH